MEATQLPSDFPLPVYEGFTVKNTIRTATSDAHGTQVEIIGDAAPEVVARFYEAEFRKRGLEVSKLTQKTETGDEVLVLGMSSTITAGIVATKEQSRTRVILSWSEKK